MTDQELCVGFREAWTLKTVGFPQDDSYFVWGEFYNKSSTVPDTKLVDLYVRGSEEVLEMQEREYIKNLVFVAAPTVAEVLEQIDLSDSGNFDAVCDILAEKGLDLSAFVVIYCQIKGGKK